MGFLDHSTNNIIVDAVLTDIGRKKLAEGTFSISKFGLGDDEVDYTIIKKFGRTPKKVKVERGEYKNVYNSNGGNTISS